MTAQTHIAPVLRPVDQPGRGALTIRNLSKTFRIDGAPLQVLSDINLDIRPGEFVSIVGASGCGKSTLLRLIVGLDTDYEGEIHLDGRRVTTTSLDRGLVFQDHRLFPWMTLEENVGLALLNTDIPKHRRAQVVAEHLALVNLTGFEKAYPHQLSGGMAQRAAIARALAASPRLLLLDEPLGALDALTRIEMHRLIERLWLERGFTAVLVTHDVAEAVALADRVILLENGAPAMDLAIDLPRPRRRDAAFARLEQRILARLLGTEAAAPEPAQADAKVRKLA